MDAAPLDSIPRGLLTPQLLDTLECAWLQAKFTNITGLGVALVVWCPRFMEMLL